MNIYVASSWRNPWQPGVVAFLRSLGHDVYDFHEPRPGQKGFGWSEIDPEWKKWSPEAFKKGLAHPIAERGFSLDMDALRAADACLLVQPCGTSAHLELGFAIGANKKTAVLYPLDVDTPRGIDVATGKPVNPTGHTLLEHGSCPKCVEAHASDVVRWCVMRAKLRAIEPELMLKAAGEILLSRAELESWLRWCGR